MEIVGRAAGFLQSTFTRWAEEAGQKTGIIRRKRKFSASTLAQVVVLTFWRSPQPRWADFETTAGTLGIKVSGNGIKDRFQQPLVEFLRELLRITVERSIKADPLPVELLQRFNGVFVGDSTCITLPPEMAHLFPGCGGSDGAGVAVLKIQTRMNLSTGAVDYFKFEAGRDCDVKSAMQDAPTPEGSLSIKDLGYYDIGRLKEQSKQGRFWISRMQCGTSVWTDEDRPRSLEQALRDHRGSGPLELSVRVGASDQMRCRLVAVRCPPEVAADRRRAVHEEHRRKGRTPSKARLEWCDWMILITNLPAERLTWKEVVVLYRSRWQIELLFKLWKSHGMIALQDAANAAQQMAFLYGRLIAVILQHTVLLATTTDISRSFVKAAQRIKDCLHSLATALRHGRSLVEFLIDLVLPLSSARIDKRTKKPSWFQLLTNPELLDWGG